MLYVDIETNDINIERTLKPLDECGEVEIARLYRDFFSFFTRDITFEEILEYVEQRVRYKDAANGGYEIEG